MGSLCDVFALALLVAVISLFLTRYFNNLTTPMFPYLLIALTALVANWINDAGGALVALALLITASFSLLGCFLYPGWRHVGPPVAEEAGAAAVNHEKRAR